MGEHKSSLVFNKCLVAVRVRDGAEKNGGCASERGDESGGEILNFKGGADEISNLHAGAQCARASMDEDASAERARKFQSRRAKRR